MEIILIGLAVGAFFLGTSIGRDTGRREVLRDMRNRIDIELQSNSDFHQKWNVRGGLVSLDFYGNSPHGIGYDSTYSGSFLVINQDDFNKKNTPLKNTVELNCDAEN